MKRFKGWRTMGLSIALTVIGALEAFGWSDFIPDNFEAFLIPIIAMAFGYLRSITTTALGKPE